MTLEEGMKYAGLERPITEDDLQYDDGDDVDIQSKIKS